MRSLFFAVSFIATVSAFALPKTVTLTGALQSRRGTTDEVQVELTLKKESATKAKYVGHVHFTNILAQNESIELNMNLAKSKSDGVINLFDGYVAFDSKAVYTMEVGQQLQLQYSEYHEDHMAPPCIPVQNNWCRPGGNDLPSLTDTGVLNLTVSQAQ